MIHRLLIDISNHKSEMFNQITTLESLDHWRHFGLSHVTFNRSNFNNKMFFSRPKFKGHSFAKDSSSSKSCSWKPFHFSSISTGNCRNQWAHRSYRNQWPNKSARICMPQPHLLWIQEAPLWIHNHSSDTCVGWCQEKQKYCKLNSATNVFRCIGVWVHF